MAYLNEYNSLEEKSKHFIMENGMYTKDVSELFRYLERLFSENKNIFRGVNNAKYKLYNSLQRQFIQREQWTNVGNDTQLYYQKLIEEIIAQTKKWNYSTISKYFDSINLDNSDDIAYLSYLQHNGFPTPLLDFTDNPFIALFFATENAELNFRSDIGINSCISLYWIDTSETIPSVIKADVDVPGTTKEILIYSEFVKRNSIRIISNNEEKYKVRNNPNIINQQGCFVFNWHALNPLEESYEMLIRQLNPTIFEKRLKLDEQKFNCLNIHKSLIPKIRSELSNSRLINSEFIYPDIAKSKDEIVNNAFIIITN